jgi:pyruvate formate lyase activating enzyme
VFLKGCPLSCPWCQNPETRDREPQVAVSKSRCMLCGTCAEVCPAEAITRSNGRLEFDRATCVRCGDCIESCPSKAREMIGKVVTVPEFVEAVARDEVFYDESRGGVTFSGGEPLAQAEFVMASLEACRQRGFHTAVDTSGYVPTETLLAVADRTDLFLYDLKIMDADRHRTELGVSNALILDNLRRLDERGSRIWIRVPLVPGMTDDEANLEALATFIAGLANASPVHVLPYHRVGAGKYERLGMPYPGGRIQPPDDTDISRVVAQLSSFGLRVKVGG